MRIKIFNTQREAMNFVFPFMKTGRFVAVKKLKTGKWEAKLFAKK